MDVVSAHWFGFNADLQMHFHTHSLETFFEYVPQEILPATLGGAAGSIEQLQGLCLVSKIKIES